LLPTPDPAPVPGPTRILSYTYWWAKRGMSGSLTPTPAPTVRPAVTQAWGLFQGMKVP